ncbi:MAG: hypothetical protein M3R41_02255, partial [Pseudomonadota bacterium]|nr:hypothetical protein [Pseudomonadota bacterium]
KWVDRLAGGAFDSYLPKAKSPCGSDVLRTGKLNDLIGDHTGPHTTSMQRCVPHERQHTE